MRRKEITQTGVGSSNPIPVNHYSENASIAVGVKVTGTVNYTVQHTFDDVFVKGFDPSAATWFAHETLAAQTANADGNYFAFPTAIRITVNSGTGAATMILVPGGA